MVLEPFTHAGLVAFLTHNRPHTNLTEIDQALSLLWRSGVSASNVVLGLAYYGRSFTLADPSCNEPGCRFTEGGKEGECSKAAGVLTMAEIERIRTTETVDEQFDIEAAVKWMTWDSDQVRCWVVSRLGRRLSAREDSCRQGLSLTTSLASPTAGIPNLRS